MLRHRDHLSSTTIATTDIFFAPMACVDKVSNLKSMAVAEGAGPVAFQRRLTVPGLSEPYPEMSVS
jgi:hypothetical protein